MLKRLLLLWIFSGSLDTFSQESGSSKLDSIPKRPPIDCCGGYATGKAINIYDLYTKPDTLRAICLVTLFPNGIAHARMGFVVICEGKEVQYLDCRKNALKLPQVGWGYRVVNPNERVR